MIVRLFRRLTRLANSSSSPYILSFILSLAFAQIIKSEIAHFILTTENCDVIYDVIYCDWGHRDSESENRESGVRGLSGTIMNLESGRECVKCLEQPDPSSRLRLCQEACDVPTSPLEHR